MRHKFIALLCLLLVSFYLLPVRTLAEEEKNNVTDGLLWKVSDEGYIIITGNIYSEQGADEDVIPESLTVPATIDGLPVKELAPYSLSTWFTPSKIILSEGLEIIRSKAFDENNMSQIVIPSTVWLIEDGAFSFCQNLEYLEVAEGNEHYRVCDGLLLNFAGTELLVCPPKRNEQVLNVPKGVEVIRSESIVECMINEIYFPDSVLTILDKAVSCCYQLKKVDAAKVNFVGNFAFSSNAEGISFYFDSPPSFIGEKPFDSGSLLYFSMPKSSEQPFQYSEREALEQYIDSLETTLEENPLQEEQVRLPEKKDKSFDALLIPVLSFGCLLAIIIIVCKKRFL